MTYLKSLVRGSALSRISGFKLSNENHTSALNLLRERFDNKQLQSRTHMNTLLKILTVSNLNNNPLVRSVYDNIESQIHSLETLDVYGPLLIPVLQSDIPSELNLQISTSFDDVTVGSLLKF